MNVLHIGNTAAIPKTLRDGLREDGIPSDIMTFYPDVLEQGTDFPHPYPTWVRVNPPLFAALRMYHLLKTVTHYDILHFHTFGGITFYADYPLWRALGKRIVLHYHGTELRRFGRELPCAKFAHKRYVSTPDLLNFAPVVTWLPSPMPLQDFSVVGVEPKDPGEPIIIVNAVASEQHGMAHKGLAIVRKAVHNVQASGYPIEFRNLVGTPYSEALTHYQQADIIIGQTHIGWYGKFEAECMAFGKPVITYIDPTVVDLVPSLDSVPVAPIHRDNVASLETQIIALIQDPAMRHDLGYAGRRYVEEWHDATKVMATLKRDYETIMHK